MTPRILKYIITCLIAAVPLLNSCARTPEIAKTEPPISTSPAQPASQVITPPPTAVDYFALGEAALGRGDRETAWRAFSLAAQSQSDVAARALAQLTKIDMTENPEKYIAVDMARDARGYVTVSLQNRAAVKVRNIKVAVAWFDASGNITKQDSLTLADQLAPKESITESTRVGPLLSDDQLPFIRVKIFSMDVDE